MKFIFCSLVSADEHAITMSKATVAFLNFIEHPSAELGREQQLNVIFSDRSLTLKFLDYLVCLLAIEERVRPKAQDSHLKNASALAAESSSAVHQTPPWPQLPGSFILNDATFFRCEDFYEPLAAYPYEFFEQHDRHGEFSSKEIHEQFKDISIDRIDAIWNAATQNEPHTVFVHIGSEIYKYISSERVGQIELEIRRLMAAKTPKKTRRS